MIEDQIEIIRSLGVSPNFDTAAETEKRIDFLASYLRAAGGRSFVLGISGGVDSLTAGLLAQAAVKRLRDSDYPAQFLAMRLPYGQQADEYDAQRALAMIGPDRIVTANIRLSSDAILEGVCKDAEDLFEPRRQDFHHGNIKARQRMVAQYALAGAAGGLVIGTDHAAEAVMGFFTKFGDGAADILPLSGLNKRRVRAIAQFFKAPLDLIFKVPTADLENETPLRPDEDAYGVTYDEIDDFLEGKAIRNSAHERILELYRVSAHKRQMPVGL